MILKGKANEYLIALGSNIESRVGYITQALDKIQETCGSLGAMASLVESEPLGPANQLFLNTAIHLYSSLEPEDLLTKLQEIENNLGRVRLQKWGNRTIDLDIILWRDKSGQCQAFNSDRLNIPHPEYQIRNFVLYPCSQIGPDWHPPGESNSLNEIFARQTHPNTSFKKLTQEIFFPIHPNFAN